MSTTKTTKKSSYMDTIVSDSLAGIVVFLVALPLCLGISTASTQVGGTSGMPFPGVLTGIIGGIVVTVVSKSKFGVSGPAAGMITIVTTAIASLGFQGFLLAMVIAGILQFLMGQFKLGFIAHFIPHSVIVGMLASIGIVLILKQFPHALGVDTANIGNMAFKDSNTGNNTFTQIMFALKYHSPRAWIISIISLIVLIVWNLKTLQKYRFFQLIPAALVVVILGVITNEVVFKTWYPIYKLEAFQKVHLPTSLSDGAKHIFAGDFSFISKDYQDLLTFPDFGQFANVEVWTTGLLIAMVASVQTLLTVEATDNLDPEKNVTPPNRELKAQGVGNLLAGLIGGIPVSQVIVRSSANINAGAKSKMGSFTHGIFLLLVVFLTPGLMNMIPKASLAVILIYLGYKLANPKLFVKSWKEGWEQFLPFFVTITAIIATDLLTGIGIGLGLAMIIILRSNYAAAYTLKEKNGKYKLSFIFVVSFLNKGTLATTLYGIPENTSLAIDAKKCHFISHDILEVIRDFATIVAKRKNIDVELIGFERYHLLDDDGNIISSENKNKHREPEKISIFKKQVAVEEK